MANKMYVRRKKQKSFYIYSHVLVLIIGLMGGIALSNSLNPPSQNSNEKDLFTYEDDTTSPAEDGSTEASIEAFPIESKRMTYTVESGDTLSMIAAEFDTSVSTILLLNNMNSSDYIYVGQELVVRDAIPDIYYGKIEDKELTLIKASADGQNEEIQSTAKVFDDDPVFLLSPDRKRYLYTESPLSSSGVGAITWVANIDGSNKLKVVDTNEAMLKDLGQVWSPDGNLVAYSFGKNLRVYSLSAESSRTIVSTLPDAYSLSEYAFSPDSSKIAFISEEGLYQRVMTFDFSTQHFAVLVELDDYQIEEVHWPLDDTVYVVATPGDSIQTIDTEVYKLQGENPVFEQVTDNKLPESNLFFAKNSSDFTFEVGYLQDESRQSELGLWFYRSGAGTMLHLLPDATNLETIGYEELLNSIYIVESDGVTKTLYSVPLGSLEESKIREGRGLVF